MDEWPPTPDPVTRTPDETRVLMLAPTGRDSELARTMLSQTGITCDLCASVEDLMQRMRTGCGPVIIAAEALQEEDTQRLTTLLDEQPPWSDLPLILFAAPSGPPRDTEQIALRRNVTLMHRPIKATTFTTMVQSALQSRMRQYELRDMMVQMESRAKQLQKLALELTQAEERERQKLARLLHDDLQQILAAALLRTSLLTKQAHDANLEKDVGALAALLQQAIEKSRNMSHDLTPPTLHQHGLIPALQWLADRMHQLHALHVELETDPSAEPEQMPLKTFLFRAAQEFLFNVVKHAGTDHATLTVSRDTQHIVLQVSDKGAGLDPQAVQNPGASQGWGMFSIQERVHLLGGDLKIEGEPGCGSTFTLTVPLRLSSARDLIQAQNEAMVTEHLGSSQDAEHKETLRVMLADDHSVLRSGLNALLANEEDIEVVAQANNGAEAVQLADTLEVDLILMDVVMPDVNGIQATRIIKQRHPEIRIIGLSMLNDSATAEKFREAGAEQHLSKADAGDHLLAAIRGKMTDEE